MPAITVRGWIKKTNKKKTLQKKLQKLIATKLDPILIFGLSKKQ